MKQLTSCQQISRIKWRHEVIFTGRNEVVAKVMFLQVCVCPQGGGGCLPQCMLGCQTLPNQAPPTPSRTRQTPPDQADPPPDQADTHYPPPPGPGTPPREADSSIRSTSGRYASYWNAFLYDVAFGKSFVHSAETVTFHREDP